MNIAVVEDNKIEQISLSKDIKSIYSGLGYHNIEFSQFNSAEDLLKDFRTAMYDIIFLDIFMGEMNGINCAKEIRKHDKTIKLVFVTSSNDFASESYSVRADNYLLKPYTYEDLSDVISSLDLSDNEDLKEIELPDNQLIPLNSIIYTSYSGHYLSIFQVTGNEIHIRMTVEAFSKVIAPFSEIVSCNKGMFVNLNKVSRLTDNCFILESNEQIPISRRKYADIKKAYSDFLIAKTIKGSD